MAKLNLVCTTCESKYQRSLLKLKAVMTGQPDNLIQVAIGAIPKPKAVSVLRESKLGSKLFLKLSCGHSITQDQSVVHSFNGNLSSIDQTKHAYDYQQEGVKFAEASGFNCLIADEMGLGKTVQAVLAWRENMDKLTPSVIVVKQSTIYQWIREFKSWASLEDLGICPILTSKTLILPVFKTFIISMDLLPDVVDKLIPMGIKFVIADEVQSFKNPSSKRSRALVKLVQDGQVKHKMFLSGTPIKNRASEYFTILNLLAPGYFPNMKQFAIRWLEPASGKSKSLNRIRRSAIEAFRELTSRWIIRREVADVQKDLPPLRQVEQEIEITDPILKQRYNQQLDLFSNWLNDPSQKKDQMSFLGWLTRLRHETALAKMGECAEMAKDFLDSTEDQKLAIGIHHKDVRDSLFYALEPYGAVKLSGEDSAQSKDWIVQRFKKPETRVMIINELAGGVGLDGLQVCNNVWLLEPQWSPTDEEQFIKRFQRDGQTKPVLATDLLAHGTIDTFFRDLKAQKKAILKDAYGQWDFTQDTESLRELSMRVIENRL